MSDIEIGKLTKSAESGQGCAITAKLQSMPYEESLRVLNQIVAENKKDQAADPDVKPLSLENFGTKFSAVVGLYRRNDFFSYDELLLNQLQITDYGASKAGDRTTKCNK